MFGFEGETGAEMVAAGTDSTGRVFADTWLEGLLGLRLVCLGVSGVSRRGVCRDAGDTTPSGPAKSQVWSLTQFYSVDFSQSRTGVNKCVFDKRTIKVCVSCC